LNARKPEQLFLRLEEEIALWSVQGGAEGGCNDRGTSDSTLYSNQASAIRCDLRERLSARAVSLHLEMYMACSGIVGQGAGNTRREEKNPENAMEADSPRLPLQYSTCLPLRPSLA